MLILPFGCSGRSAFPRHGNPSQVRGQHLGFRKPQDKNQDKIDFVDFRSGVVKSHSKEKPFWSTIRSLGGTSCKNRHKLMLMVML